MRPVFPFLPSCSNARDRAGAARSFPFLPSLSFRCKSFASTKGRRNKKCTGKRTGWSSRSCSRHNASLCAPSARLAMLLILLHFNGAYHHNAAQTSHFSLRSHFNLRISQVGVLLSILPLYRDYLVLALPYYLNFRILMSLSSWCWLEQQSITRATQRDQSFGNFIVL